MRSSLPDEASIHMVISKLFFDPLSGSGLGEKSEKDSDPARPSARRSRFGSVLRLRARGGEKAREQESGGSEFEMLTGFFFGSCLPVRAFYRRSGLMEDEYVAREGRKMIPDFKGGGSDAKMEIARTKVLTQMI